MFSVYCVHGHGPIKVEDDTCTIILEHKVC
jgi:hypothetical protein